MQKLGEHGDIDVHFLSTAMWKQMLHDNNVHALTCECLPPAFVLRRPQVPHRQASPTTFGALGAALRSDMKLPEPVFAAISMYLMLAIGMKGGAELAGRPLSEVLAPAMAGLALGADAYVTKPFSTRDLVEQVKRMLGVV